MFSGVFEVYSTRGNFFLVLWTWCLKPGWVVETLVGTYLWYDPLIIYIYSYRIMSPSSYISTYFLQWWQWLLRNQLHTRHIYHLSQDSGHIVKRERKRIYKPEDWKWCCYYNFIILLYYIILLLCVRTHTPACVWK